MSEKLPYRYYQLNGNVGAQVFPVNKCSSNHATGNKLLRFKPGGGGAIHLLTNSLKYKYKTGTYRYLVCEICYLLSVNHPTTK